MKDKEIEEIVKKIEEDIKQGKTTKEKIRQELKEYLLKNSRYQIPLERIPRGVMICLKNAERLKKDAEVLNEKLSFQTAIATIITSIEEFSKAIWLANHFDKNMPTKHNEGYAIFNKHPPKIKIFFDYLQSLDGYQIVSGTNKFVGMVDEIGNDQFYKLRMLYVDYNPYEKSKYWSNDDGWIDPTYIWQLSFMDDTDTMHSLSTKYDELRKDLGYAITTFTNSELYKKIVQVLPPPPIEPNIVGSFLRKHFPIERIQMSLGTGTSTIDVVLSPTKNQTLDNRISPEEMKIKLQQYFKIQNVSVRIEPK